jgi:hypothetical protein
MMLFFLAFTTIGFSQGYIPVTTTTRTPYGNVHQTNYINNPRYNYGNGPMVTMKFDLEIILQNDSVISKTSQIDFSDRVHFITFKHGKIKTNIKPSETKKVYRYSSAGRKIVGIPADTCWLFLVEKGKINSYSAFPYEMDPIVVAIQNGSGAIVPLTKASLRAMMNTNDEKLLRLIEREKFEKAIHLYNYPVAPKATVFDK